MKSCLRSTSQFEGNQSFFPQHEKDLKIPLQRDLRPDSPALTREQSHAPPGNSNGDWTSLRQQERLPEFCVITREKPKLPEQLEKNHKIPPLSGDEALLFLQGLGSNLELSLKTP